LNSKQKEIIEVIKPVGNIPLVFPKFPLKSNKLYILECTEVCFGISISKIVRVGPNLT
jgi:hypothetical protein